MEKFKIIRDYYDTNEKIYDKSSAQFEPGLTVLIGCNGSGKTTLLRQIKSGCEDKNIPVIMFDNYSEGGSSATSWAGFIGDFDKVARDAMSSEGEKISDNLNIIAGKIGGFVRKNSSAEKIFILLDAIDSGYSIDNVIELKRDLFDFIIKDCEKSNIEVYIIVSCNGYEMARNEKCFNVSSCKYVTVNSYDEYRDIVINTRKKKNRRYGWAEFEESTTRG